MKYTILIPSCSISELTTLKFNNFLLNIENYYSIKDLEVIIILDGSIDESYEKVMQLEHEHIYLRHVGYKKNRGKGFAIWYGLKYTRGDYVAYYDVDCATNIKSLIELLSYSTKNNISCLGSRYLSSSRKIKQAWIRKFAGKTFNFIVRKNLKIPFKDTQCGCKVFTPEAVKYLKLQKWSSGFSFDIEIIIKLLNNDFELKEIPIIWKENRVNFINNFLSILIMAPTMYREIFHLKKKGIRVYD